MADDSWVAKAGGDVHPGVIQHLRRMIDASSQAQRTRLESGGLLKVGNHNTTVFSAGTYEYFKRFADTLKTVLGDPTENESVVIKGETHNHRIHFHGGITIVYMLSRSDGMSINIPLESTAMLTEKLNNLESARASKESPTPIV